MTTPANLDAVTQTFDAIAGEYETASRGEVPGFFGLGRVRMTRDDNGFSAYFSANTESGMTPYVGPYNVDCDGNRVESLSPQGNSAQTEFSYRGISPWDNQLARGVQDVDRAYQRGLSGSRGLGFEGGAC